ncbi:MAG: hypothetical protein CMI90_07110 [Pelagibacteraceae bacterium]|nr:hypothetical protein [Pelagibacteraceae bacterium]
MIVVKKDFKNYLNLFWSSGGLKRDDNILIHSNLKNLILLLRKKKFSFKVEDIIYNLLDYLGPKATLIFPTFTFNFTSSKFFSVSETKSEMGIMSETARKLCKKNRTWHPIYSFAILGNVPKDQILKKNYSALGQDSMFGWLIENEGKVAVIDLNDQECMTIYHHIEEMNNVEWRCLKSFEGLYKDWNLKQTKIKAKTFVRKDKNRIVTDVGGMQKYLMDRDYYFCQNNKSTKGIRSIKSVIIKKNVEKILKKGIAKGLLYSTK